MLSSPYDPSFAALAAQTTTTNAPTNAYAASNLVYAPSSAPNGYPIQQFAQPQAQWPQHPQSTHSFHPGAQTAPMPSYHMYRPANNGGALHGWPIPQAAIPHPARPIVFHPRAARMPAASAPTSSLGGGDIVNLRNGGAPYGWPVQRQAVPPQGPSSQNPQPTHSSTTVPNFVPRPVPIPNLPPSGFTFIYPVAGTVPVNQFTPAPVPNAHAGASSTAGPSQVTAATSDPFRYYPHWNPAPAPAPTPAAAPIPPANTGPPSAALQSEMARIMQNQRLFLQREQQVQPVFHQQLRMQWQQQPHYQPLMAQPAVAGAVSTNHNSTSGVAKRPRTVSSANCDDQPAKRLKRSSDGTVPEPQAAPDPQAAPKPDVLPESQQPVFEDTPAHPPTPSRSAFENIVNTPSPKSLGRRGDKFETPHEDSVEDTLLKQAPGSVCEPEDIFSAFVAVPNDEDNDALAGTRPLPPMLNLANLAACGTDEDIEPTCMASAQGTLPALVTDYLFGDLPSDPFLRTTHEESVRVAERFLALSGIDEIWDLDDKEMPALVMPVDQGYVDPNDILILP
ncbi:unnamed protein product [Mycena citricolor]|uniref:Uncharacterized protein n=1 Tax=Mycena citricolor TaxID=2018698 RepID=A0AAD2HIL2_9AGAR|nr:unnamed protein product [Mycena citricolor]